MKAADLKAVIRKIVAEEVSIQLPQILSEMYVRKIVSESAPARQQRQPREQPVTQLRQQPVKAARRSLAESLGVEDPGFPEDPRAQRQQPDERYDHEQSFVRHDVAETLLDSGNPFRDMIAETIQSMQEEPEYADPEESLPALDFGVMGKIAEGLERKTKMRSADDIEFERRRIEMQREKLNSMRVKS